MGYRVTRKFMPPPGSVHAPGEHYEVENPQSGTSLYRTCYFYRTPRGSELATDKLGERLASDGDLFRAVKEAVDAYDDLEHTRALESG
jgi:hypothetical protein